MFTPPRETPPHTRTTARAQRTALSGTPHTAAGAATTTTIITYRHGERSVTLSHVQLRPHTTHYSTATTATSHSIDPRPPPAPVRGPREQTRFALSHHRTQHTKYTVLS